MRRAALVGPMTWLLAVALVACASTERAGPAPGEPLPVEQPPAAVEQADPGQATEPPAEPLAPKPVATEPDAKAGSVGGGAEPAFDPAGDESAPLLRWPVPSVPPEGASFWEWVYGSDEELVAEIVTDQGSLVIGFLPEVARCNVSNFIDLARSGFYDGLSFHRIVTDFIVQGGCPVGDGSGGPGRQVDAELDESLHHERGTVSMAHMGHPDSAGSQFFICLDRQPNLDGKWTLFGRVIAGLDTLDAIAKLGSASGEPVREVLMRNVIIRPRTADESDKEP